MMRLKILAISVILTYLLTGCNKEEDNMYPLDFFEVSN